MKTLRPHQISALRALTTATKGIINLPTGTGKTLIQARAIYDEIIGTKRRSKTKVYMIVSPRILLSNQLMHEVRKDLSTQGTEAQYLVVHSGRYEDKQDIEFEHDLGITFRETLSGTTHDVIRDAYKRAAAERVPLVISSTYHSVDRIRSAGIPVEIAFCDEAHYLVQEQFSWIVADPFPAKRSFYFTATLRVTPSVDGMGMNNERLFGKVLYTQTPAMLIEAGEMVRPRMHMVDMSTDPCRDEADGLAVARAFEHHHAAVSVGAKMLVVAKDGSDHLDVLASHAEIQRLLEVRPRLKVYDISSKHGARINGAAVKRETFLKELQGLSDSDEAIIVHHDILSEGIDIPGITGVMPLISLGKAKFLQTLGRATRLHVTDRARLYNAEITSANLDRFIKPYAWLIIPVYGEVGEDMRENMKEMIVALRDYDFDPSEDIVIRQARGSLLPVQIEMVTTPTRAVASMLEFSAVVMHEIEDEEEATELTNFARIVNSTDDFAALLEMVLEQ